MEGFPSHLYDSDRPLGEVTITSLRAAARVRALFATRLTIGFFSSQSERLPPHVVLQTIGAESGVWFLVEARHASADRWQDLDKLHRFCQDKKKTAIVKLDGAWEAHLVPVPPPPPAAAPAAAAAECLSFVISSTLRAAAAHPDALMRRAAVAVLARLAADWCPEPERVPGFRRFVVEQFAPECCLYGMLQPDFDFADANTAALFAEIVSAQKAIYAACGDEFLLHWATHVLPAVRCPPNAAEQYCLHLQRSSVKDLRVFLRALVEQLRPLQAAAAERQNGIARP